MKPLLAQEAHELSTRGSSFYVCGCVELETLLSVVLGCTLFGSILIISILLSLFLSSGISTLFLFVACLPRPELVFKSHYVSHCSCASES